MTTDLTGNKIKDTYQQILHVDGGVTSTDKTVYDGDGTATALKVSTTSVDVSSLKLAGSAITVTATQINAGVNAQPAAEAAALAAASSATAASVSATSAATTYDQFDDRYLGSKSSAPTVDNDGNALLTGALYFNSVTTNMNVWTGSAWSATYIPVTGYAPLANPLFTGAVKENGLNIVSQTDIGTAPNEIPLNQYLGSIAYQDSNNVNIGGGLLAGLDIQGLAADISADGINTGLVNANGFVSSSSSVLRGGATNLFQRSEEFDNAYWPKGTLTVTANTIVAPDNTLNGDALARNTTTTSESMLRVSTTQAVSTTFTLSVYAKAGTAGNLLYFRNGAVNDGTSTGLVKFNLATGSVDLTFGSTYTGKASMTSVGNGWYRCVITGTTPATIANNFIDIGCSSSGTIGGTAGDFLYLWGAQLEASSTAGAYIKTVADAITTAYAAPIESPNGIAIPLLSTMTPARRGDMSFQLTSDTSLVVKVKGSDGTVRSATLTLA